MAVSSTDDMANIDAFFGCVKAVCSSDETLEQLMAGLKKRLNHPPTAALSSVLQKELDDTTVRQLLFTPTPADMAVYPVLLQGDTNNPTDLSSNAANRVQTVALGHLYLVHGRCWERLKPCIEAGGLRPLAALLSHPNPMLASQALQVLLLATHPDMYDWHHPPSYADNNSSSGNSAGTSSHTSDKSAAQHAASSNTNSPSADSTDTVLKANVNASDSSADNSSASSNAAGINTVGGRSCSDRDSTQQHAPSSDKSLSCKGSNVLRHPSQGQDGVLWRELLQLQEGPFMPALLRLSPDVWPGAGHQALQLLAFYLLWLRAWWSKEGVLQLSDALLKGLEAWSARVSALPEERNLAAQLLQDFGKYGPAQPPKVPLSASAATKAAGSKAASSANIAMKHGGRSAGDRENIQIGTSICMAYEPMEEGRVVADRTQVNTAPGSEAARLKAAGNDAFKARDWATAIRLYSAALDVPVPAAALIDEGPRRAVYHTNRAAAYLERVWELQTTAAANHSASSDSCAAGSNSSSNKGFGGGSSSSRNGSSNQCSSNGMSSWIEVGGVLDGAELSEFDVDSIGKQLEAAVIDCRAALELTPTYPKAHYRLATALNAQGKLTQALTAAQAAQQHANTDTDRAAAAKLAAIIQQQQQRKHAICGAQPQQIQPTTQQSTQQLRQQRDHEGGNGEHRQKKQQQLQGGSANVLTTLLKCEVDGGHIQQPEGVQQQQVELPSGVQPANTVTSVQGDGAKDSSAKATNKTTERPLVPAAAAAAANPLDQLLGQFAAALQQQSKPQLPVLGTTGSSAAKECNGRQGAGEPMDPEHSADSGTNNLDKLLFLPQRVSTIQQQRQERQHKQQQQVGSQLPGSKTGRPLIEVLASTDAEGC